MVDMYISALIILRIFQCERIFWHDKYLNQILQPIYIIFLEGTNHFNQLIMESFKTVFQIWVQYVITH